MIYLESANRKSRDVTHEMALYSFAPHFAGRRALIKSRKLQLTTRQVENNFCPIKWQLRSHKAMVVANDTIQLSWCLNSFADYHRFRLITKNKKFWTEIFSVSGVASLLYVSPKELAWVSSFPGQAITEQHKPRMFPGVSAAFVGFNPL